jgi:hypothetical protein
LIRRLIHLRRLQQPLQQEQHARLAGAQEAAAVASFIPSPKRPAGVERGP